jgi:hypothetical protein
MKDLKIPKKTKSQQKKYLGFYKNATFVVKTTY